MKTYKRLTKYFKHELKSNFRMLIVAQFLCGALTIAPNTICALLILFGSIFSALILNYLK